MSSIIRSKRNPLALSTCLSLIILILTLLGKVMGAEDDCSKRKNREEGSERVGEWRKLKNSSSEKSYKEDYSWTGSWSEGGFCTSEFKC